MSRNPGRIEWAMSDGFAPHDRSAPLPDRLADIRATLQHLADSIGVVSDELDDVLDPEEQPPATGALGTLQRLAASRVRALDDIIRGMKATGRSAGSKRRPQMS
jgi:hypothetical protein